MTVTSPTGSARPQRPPLDSEVERWLARIEQVEAEVTGADSTDLQVRRRAARTLSDTLAQEFTLPVPGGVTIADDRLDSPHGSVLVRRYRPSGLPAAAPTLVWLHGGGGWAGSVHELVNDRLLSRRARDAGIQIVAIAYRLAPEHVFPAAAEDVVAVVDALRSAPERLGVDVERLALGGVSAGGWVAAVAALSLRDRPTRLRLLVLEVPALGLRVVAGDDGTDLGHPVHQTAEQLAALRRLALGGDVPQGSQTVPAEYAEPLDVADLSGLPPTLLMLAEHDPLRWGATRYARRLRRAGVDVAVETGRGHLHATAALTAVYAPARQWQERICAELRATLTSSGTDPDANETGQR